MATLLAKTEQTALFNRLFGADARDSGIWWETGAWQQALWRLRALDRKWPGDFVIKVTLAGVLLRLARFEEGREALRSAHDLRLATLVPAQSLLGMLHATVGDMARGRIVMDEILRDPALRMQEPALNNAAHFAFLEGDVQRLAEIAEMDHRRDRPGAAASLTATIEASGLADHLAAHQTIVRDLVAPRQCGLDITFVDDGEWPPAISHHAYLAAAQPESRRVQRRLIDGLADLYEAAGLKPGVYLPYFCTHITALDDPATDL